MFSEIHSAGVVAKMLWPILGIDDWRWGNWCPLCFHTGPLQNPKYEEIHPDSHVYLVNNDKLDQKFVLICGCSWMLPSPQAHHRGGLSRPHHAGGDTKRKPLHWLPHLKSDGAPCMPLHPLHCWTNGASTSLLRIQHCNWIGLLDHCLHPWEWAPLYIQTVPVI